MNQILVTSLEKKQKRKSLVYLKWQFIFSLVFACLFCFYYFYEQYSIANQDISKNLTSNFNIATLYSSYSIPPSSTNDNLNHVTDSNDFTVIGTIKIDKIKIEYPILSHTNDTLLKMAPCRFYGPMPNTAGNLCIAGHNYNDSRFFSRVSKLEKNDLIQITDSSGLTLSYLVYDKYEVDAQDTSCTEQRNSIIKELTLVTCNNLTGSRIIIKAVESN